MKKSKLCRKGSTSSIGLPGILFVIFLVLKLVGVISWSWWWVTCPLWIGFAFIGVIALVGLVLGGGALGVMKLFDR